MNLKEIIKQENQKVADNEYAKKMQKKLIKDYEKNINLGESLVNKLAINKSYRDEVHQFFIDSGFKKSDTNHNGNTIVSDSITYYKCENTWMEISFSERSETEEIIQVVRPVEGKYLALIYKLDDNFEKMLEYKVTPRLNNEIILATNYQEEILKCDSIEELSKLENQIKENMEHTESNLNKDINFVGVYQLQDNRQFISFTEAFEAL